MVFLIFLPMNYIMIKLILNILNFSKDNFQSIGNLIQILF